MGFIEHFGLIVSPLELLAKGTVTDFSAYSTLYRLTVPNGNE